MWFVFKSKFFTGISETCSGLITAWILQKMLLSYVSKENICCAWTRVVSHFVDLWVGVSIDALTSYCTKTVKRHAFKGLNWTLMPSFYIKCYLWKQTSINTSVGSASRLSLMVGFHPTWKTTYLVYQFDFILIWFNTGLQWNNYYVMDI